MHRAKLYPGQRQGVNEIWKILHTYYILNWEHFWQNQGLSIPCFKHGFGVYFFKGWGKQAQRRAERAAGKQNSFYHYSKMR